MGREQDAQLQLEERGGRDVRYSMRGWWWVKEICLPGAQDEEMEEREDCKGVRPTQREAER